MNSPDLLSTLITLTRVLTVLTGALIVFLLINCTSLYRRVIRNHNKQQAKRG